MTYVLCVCIVCVYVCVSLPRTGLGDGADRCAVCMYMCVCVYVCVFMCMCIYVYNVQNLEMKMTDVVCVRMCVFMCNIVYCMCTYVYVHSVQDLEMEMTDVLCKINEIKLKEHLKRHTLLDDVTESTSQA